MGQEKSVSCLYSSSFNTAKVGLGFGVCFLKVLDSYIRFSLLTKIELNVSKKLSAEEKQILSHFEQSLILQRSCKKLKVLKSIKYEEKP